MSKKYHEDVVLSRAEEAALGLSASEIIYRPTEKIPALVVEHFPLLGQLTAMRFLEWAQANPGGTVSLPTGKTPEFFIKLVCHLLDTWDSPDTKKVLAEGGVNPDVKPDIHSMHFVQMDEFYPISPSQENSFFHYVNKYYINGFGLDPKKALLMDCSCIGVDSEEDLNRVWPDGKVDLSLRNREPQSTLEEKQKASIARVDQWCQEYEHKIRELGGIGFFLGGIGPDGHIAFNVRGTDHYSTTRLTETNYETQAAAAVDLGGIETARGHLVITIGIGTITYNKDCTAVIMASGHTKASVVAHSAQNEEDVMYPASALQSLPNGRFYLTKGAASKLVARQKESLSKQDSLSEEATNKILMDAATEERKSLKDLTKALMKNNAMGPILLSKRPGNFQELTKKASETVASKIAEGARHLASTRFLHTEPHHDDIMLGYLPGVIRHIRDATDTHHFVTLTSGFTSVTNNYLDLILKNASDYMRNNSFARLWAEEYFNPKTEKTRQRDVWEFLDGVAEKSQKHKISGTSRRALRNIISIYGEKDPAGIEKRLSKLRSYIAEAYPGKKDSEDIQELKGMCREWEAECLWGYFGWNCTNVFHLRLGFYKGDIFTEEPTLERDVVPILQLLEKVKPDVITVAFDPEGAGPDTHYKALQAITEALKRYEKSQGRSDLKIWGYRNVWHRFHPAEANIYVPVSLNTFSVMNDAFINTFESQKNASFPSHEHDGPFCELAQKIQVEQYQAIKTCLGRNWFHEHPSALIRATRGLVFLKQMTLNEFYGYSRRLRTATENR